MRKTFTGNRPDRRGIQKSARIQKFSSVRATYPRPMNISGIRNPSVSGLIVRPSIRTGETKSLDIPLTLQALSTTAVIVPLNLIRVGSSFFNRIGRRVEMKSLHFIGNMDTTGNAAGIDDYIRIIIVYDAQTNGTLPTIQSILQDTQEDSTNTTTSYSGLNLNNRDRFTILMDHRIGIARDGGASTDAVTEIAGGDTGENANTSQFNRFIKLRGLLTQYGADSSPSVIGDINTGGLLSSLVTTPAVTNAGTVNVTGTSTPQQVDQAVVNLVNSQLAANTGTPAKLANVEVTGSRPATTQDVVGAITSSLPLTNTSIPTQTITAPKLTTVGETLAALPSTLLPPSVTTPATTTDAKKTNELGLTDEQMANLIKAGLGLFGTLGATSALSNRGTTVPVGSLPTQLPPMYTDDYFTKVQQNYNRLLPAVPRDVASPLRDWYTSQYGA